MAGYQRVLNYQRETERLLSAIKGNTNGFFFLFTTLILATCVNTQKNGGLFMCINPVVAGYLSLIAL